MKRVTLRLIAPTSLLVSILLVGSFLAVPVAQMQTPSGSPTPSGMSRRVFLPVVLSRLSHPAYSTTAVVGTAGGIVQIPDGTPSSPLKQCRISG